MKITIKGKRLAPKVDKNTGDTHINTVIHFSYKDDRVEGDAAGHEWVGAYCCPPEQIIVGKSYDMEKFNGYVVHLMLIGEGKNEPYQACDSLKTRAEK